MSRSYIVDLLDEVIEYVINWKPNIPKMPTIIITKKPKSKRTANNDIKHDEDEKKVHTDTKIKKINRFSPMMCRVNFVCSTKKAKQEIYSALQTFVDLQINTPHSQTIMYHFTAPNKAGNDLELEFNELYLNQTIYFEHGNHPSFGKAFLNAFKDENRKSRCFITIGQNLSNLIKKINASFDSTFPQSDAGYLLHENYLKVLDRADNTKMMVKFKIISPKKENIAVIIAMMNKLSVYAKQSFAVMFNLHRMDEKLYPDKFELISIWPNNQCLMRFFENCSVNDILSEFKKMIINETDGLITKKKQHLLLELYGENIANDIFEKIHEIFSDIGVIKTVETDIGYILHPKANSSGLK